MDPKINEMIEVEASETASSVVGHNPTVSDDTAETVSTRSKMSPKNQKTAYNERTFLKFYIAMQLCGTLALGCMLIWTWKYYNGFGWADANDRFNFHPVMMVLGMIYLSGNSILAFRVLKNQPKPLVKIVHASLHISAFTTALIGSIAVFTNHFDTGKPNLYSLHSWIGGSTMLLFFLQYVAGFYNFLFPTTSSAVRSALLPYHVLGGIAIFALATMAAVTGFAEKMAFDVKNYSNFSGRMWWMNFAAVFLIIYSFIVLYLATDRSYKRHAVGEQLPLTQDFRGNSSNAQSLVDN